MIVTTLSPKNQTTVGAEIIRSLGLGPGTRLQQWTDGEMIMMKPLPDVMTAFGSLKSDVKFTSIAAETEAAELAIAEDAMRGMRD